MLRKATPRARNVPQRPCLWAKFNQNTVNAGKWKIPLDKPYSEAGKVSEISGAGERRCLAAQKTTRLRGKP